MLEKSNRNLQWVNSNTNRYYSAFIQKDLFDNWVLIKHWRGLNQNGGKVSQVVCHSFYIALALMNSIIMKRKKRGYELI